MKIFDCFLHSGVCAILVLGMVSLVPAASAQAPTQPAPAFEVATVKPNNSGSGSSHGGFVGDDRFQAVNVTVKSLLQYQAFNVSAPRILGSPRWLASQRYDIDAKMEAATAAQLKVMDKDNKILARQAMFQQLLADRFKLVTHWEERELPVYAITVAKGGPRLQQPAHPERSTRTDVDSGKFDGRNVTLTQVAEFFTHELSDQLGRVVIDKTGIAGTYDIALKWTADSGGDSNVGPSLFTAIQEQLGLKFESSKAPVKMLVIDRLEMPSEN